MATELRKTELASANAELTKEITERKSAEEALRESEQLSRSILENIDEIIYIVSAGSGDPVRGIVQFVSGRVEQIIGYKPDEFVNDPELWFNLLHPDDVPAVVDSTRKIFQEKQSLNRVYRVRHKHTGQYRWMEDHVVPRLDDAGAVVATFGVARDITERKRAYQKFRGLLESAPDAMVITDHYNEIVLLNSQTENLFGYSKAELLGQKIEILIPERFRDKHQGDRAGYFESPKTRPMGAGFELLGVRKDGTEFPVEISLSPLEIEEGRLVISAIRDITERKRAEAALQESEERFRQLSEAAFEAIILHDNGTILEVNQSFCRMYGYERAEVIGKSVLDLTLPKFRELFLQKVRSEGTDPFEGPALRKDGTIFRTEVAGKPIHYQGRVVRVAAIRDITEQERNERRQAAQYAVTRVLAESATLAEATPQLLQVICESLRWKMGECWRVCDSTNLLRCVETWHVPALDATSFIEASRQTELTPGAGLPGRVWQSGQPAWIPDVMTDPGFARAAIAAKAGLRGAVAFPILLGNLTLGVMLFFSRRTPEVDEDLLKIMSAIGSQIGQFTERKGAEGALREKGHLLSESQRIAHIGSWRGDLTGPIKWTDETYRIYGVSPETFTPTTESLVNLLHPEDRPAMQRWLEACGAGQSPDDLEFRAILPDGSVRLLSGRGELVHDTENRPAYMAGTVQDVTARKRAQDALRESEERYRDLVENSRELMCTHDLDGRVLSANRAAAEALGYDSNELLEGKNIRDILAPEVRHEFEQYMASLRERDATSGVMLVETSTGERRMWEYYNSLRTEGVATPIVRGMALDITERRRAETALRESEERYRDLVENSQEFICTHDLDGLILSANRAAVEVLGYDPKDYYGKRNLRELLVPEVRDQFDDYLARIRRDGFASGLLMVQTSSGERRVWEYHNTVRTEGVAAPIVRSMAHDVTEQRRAEKAMSDLRRELELTMNSMEEGVHRVDLKGNIVFENPAAARMLGWEIDQLLGKRAHPTMHHTRQDGTPYPTEECPVYATFRDGVSRHVADEVFWRQDGTSFPVEYMSAPMRNDRNEIVAAVVTFRDITKRKRAEQALRESEERYRELFENARDAIYVHDLKGNYTSVNRAAEKLSGYTREEILGRNFADFVAPGDFRTIRGRLREKLADGRQTAYEFEMIAKDGRRVPVEVTSSLIYENSTAVGVQGMARDITERKLAEMAMRNYSRRLIEAQEEERQRIARELHDQIGQVLTAVRINLHNVQRASNTIAASPHIEESIRVLDEALDQVRNLSLDLRPSLLDDLGLVTALRWYVDRQAQRTGVRTQVLIELPDNNMRFSRELETACFRIAQEALTNVARHAQAKRVSVQLQRDETDLLLTIKDDGVGFNVRALRKRAPGAATLGLRGMQERAHAVDGRIEIDSAPSKGTEIRARFPISIKS